MIRRNILTVSHSYPIQAIRSVLILSVVPSHYEFFLGLTETNCRVDVLCSLVCDSNIGHVFELVSTNPSIVLKVILTTDTNMHWWNPTSRLLRDWWFLL